MTTINLKTHLQSTQVGSVIKDHQHVIEVHSSNSVKASALALSKNNISSIAVYGEPGHWIGAGGQMLEADGKQYIGLVSAFDLVSHILSKVDKGTDPAQALKQTLDEPVVHLVGDSQESLSLWWLKGEDKLSQLYEEFAKGVHRALILESTNSIKLYTQTDALVHLLKTNHPILHTTMGAFAGAVPQRSVVKVKGDAQLIDAINTMVTNQVLAVPVFNVHETAIMTTLSVSDFQHIIDETDGGLIVSPSFLEHTVASFLDSIEGELRPPLMFNSNNTLRQTIMMMVQHHVHRLWTMGDNGSVGVFSMTDIFKLLLNMD